MKPDDPEKTTDLRQNIGRAYSQVHESRNQQVQREVEEKNMQRDKRRHTNGRVNNNNLPTETPAGLLPWYADVGNGVAYQNGGPSHKRSPETHGRDSNFDRTIRMVRDSVDDDKARRKQRQNRKKKRCLHRLNGAIISFLETFFYKWGFLVGSHPKKFIAGCVVVPLLLGIGLIKFHLAEDIGELLLPPDTRFLEDRVWIENNILANREERVVNIIIEDNNVLTRKVLTAMMDFVDEFDKVREGDLSFRDICMRVKGRCVVSSLLDIWQYNRTIIETLTEDQILSAVNTVTINPTYLTPLNTTRMLGDITMDTSASDVIRAATATSMFWHHVTTPEMKDKVLELEKKIIKIAKKGHNDLQGVYVFTLDSYNDEFFSAVYGDLFLLILSFPLVVIYLIITFGKPTLIEHGFPLMGAAMAGVLLSGITCYGICLSAGLTFGATHQALMFLLIAVGVDDAFIITETMKRVKRTAPDEPIHVQVAMTMKHAGVSVTVTSISDVAAFATGISTIIPLLSSFCVYSAVGVLALFIMQSTLFPACYVLNERRIRAKRNACCPCYVHKENYQPNKWKDIEVMEAFFTKYYGPVITTIPAKIIVLLITVAMGALMTWSLTTLEKGFDLKVSVSPESFARKYLEINDKYFTGVGTGAIIYCADMDVQKNFDKLETMLDNFQKSNANQFGTVRSWIPAFKLWLASINHSQILDTIGNTTVDGDEFYRLLRQFTNQSDYGAIFANDIHFYNSSATSRVQWTEFSFSIKHDDNQQKNVDYMNEVRSIADNADTEGGMCIVNSNGFLFLESMKFVDVELLKNFIMAGSAVFLVTLILIVNPLTCFFVLICVVLTTLELGGVVNFWGYKMDGSMVVLLTFSIGLAVDFSAHVGHMFMTVTGSKDERVRKTLSKIGPAVFHGGFSTFLGVSGLAFAKSFGLSLFFSTFLTVVIFGLFHGLCFLPVILSIIGPSPYDLDEPENVTWPENALKLNSDSLFTIPRPKLYLEEKD